MESDFRFDVIFQIGGHDNISHMLNRENEQLRLTEKCCHLTS